MLPVYRCTRKVTVIVLKLLSYAVRLARIGPIREVAIS